MNSNINKYFDKMSRRSTSRVYGREWEVLKQFLEANDWKALGERLLRLARQVIHGDEKALLEFYNKSVVPIRENLRPYMLVEITEVVVRSIDREPIAVSIINDIGRVVESSYDASQYVNILRGLVFLHKEKNLGASKAFLDELCGEFESHEDPSQLRNYTKFYAFAAEYYFHTGDWEHSYRARLNYISVDLKSYPKNLWPEQAFLLVVNALLVKNKFDFRDVVEHRVTDSLRNDKLQWVLKLLDAFRSGDVQRFRELRLQWIKVPQLCDNESSLWQRLYVLTVLSLVDQRTNKSCTIYFVELAMEIEKSVDYVENIIQLAMDAELINAKVDSKVKLVEIFSMKPIYFNAKEESKVKANGNSWEQKYSEFEPGDFASSD